MSQQIAPPHTPLGIPHGSAIWNWHSDFETFQYQNYYQTYDVGNQYLNGEGLNTAFLEGHALSGSTASFVTNPAFPGAPQTSGGLGNRYTYFPQFPPNVIIDTMTVTWNAIFTVIFKRENTSLTDSGNFSLPAVTVGVGLFWLTNVVWDFRKTGVTAAIAPTALGTYDGTTNYNGSSGFTQTQNIHLNGVATVGGVANYGWDTNSYFVFNGGGSGAQGVQNGPITMMPAAYILHPTPTWSGTSAANVVAADLMRCAGSFDVDFLYHW